MYILGPSWALFEFSWKKDYQFLNIPIIYHCTKKPKKTDEPFLRKVPTQRQSVRQTDRQLWFYRGLSGRRGSNKRTSELNL